MRNIITLSQFVGGVGLYNQPKTAKIHLRVSHITAFYHADTHPAAPHYHQVVECGLNTYRVLETCAEIEALINKAEGA